MDDAKSAYPRKATFHNALIYFHLFLNLYFLGGSPYPLLTNTEVMRRLKTGYRMEKPDLCSDHV